MNKTPKLRFKEFSGDWEFSRLSKACEINPKTKEIPDKFYYIDLESVVKGELVKDNIVIKEEAPSRAQRLLSPKDTLFQTVRPYQNNNYYFDSDKDLPTVASTGYAQLRSHRNSEFLYQLIHTPRFGKNVLLRCTGSNYPAINTTDLSEIEIYYPSKEEQEKIASFFSLIDDKISLQGEKLEMLKDYKSGMMQKIFSRELRFKDDDGRDYPEWEENKLGTLFNIKAGGDIKSENVSKEMTEKNIYPIYANALSNKGLYGYTDTFKVEGDTITVTGRGDIGYAIARNDKYYPIVRLLVLSPIENLNTIFFENIINFTNIFVESTGVPQLTSPQLSQVKVSVPVFEEQNKIAKLLKGIDIKIEKEQDKLDSLNEYKKGLLQQMFV